MPDLDQPVNQPIVFDEATGATRFLLDDGNTLTLPRPNFGQLEQILTMNAARLDALLEQLEAERTRRAGEDESAPLTFAERVQVGFAQHRSLIDYWRRVGEVLGVAFPPADALPAYFADPRLPALIEDHWTSHPFRALGVPDLPTPRAEAATDEAK